MKKSILFVPIVIIISIFSIGASNLQCLKLFQKMKRKF